MAPVAPIAVTTERGDDPRRARQRNRNDDRIREE